MESVTVKAPAKINWYLNVLSKRSDGYHNIETVMQTVDIYYDTLTIKRNAGKDIRINIDNNVFGIDTAENNIIYKAAKKLGVYGVEIYLKKNIPVEAGLGGGSSDAASAMNVFNDMFELGLSKKELAARAAEVGADVPFFIYGSACIARGIGEQIEPVQPVTRYGFRIIKPCKGLSTGLIYSLMDKEEPQVCPSLDTFLRHFNNADDELAKYMFNAMDKVSAELCPEIGEAKKKLIDEGCIAAMMSGSGSAVFGLMKK